MHKRAAWSLVIAVVAASALPPPVSAQSSPAATPAPRFMVFAGDSIMAGGGSSTAAHTVVNLLGELRPYWWIRNYSIAGTTVSGCPTYGAMNANDIVPLLGNPIVVFLGTNDWGCSIPIAKFKISYSNFIRTLDGLHPQVICVTPIWRADDGTLNSAGCKLDDYRKEIAQICAADGHPVIDGSPMVPHDPKNYVDGVHPNDTGYSYYAQNLAEALDRFVRP